jgi:hypothetical protein
MKMNDENNSSFNIRHFSMVGEEKMVPVQGLEPRTPRI